MAKKKKRKAAPPQPPGGQPPPAAPDQGGGGGGGYFQYTPTAESQFNQPYQDVLAAGALGALPGVMSRMGQQSQIGDLYAKGAATNLGGAAQGMQKLAPLGGQYMDASGNLLQGAQAGMQPLGQMGMQATGLGAGTLGQYGQLMDPNLSIQGNLANQIQRIQAGAESGFDPLLDQQLGTEERLLHEQLRRQLGPDYANSSAGIEALGKFEQRRQITLGTSRFNQLNALLGQQQGGLQNMTGIGTQLGGFGQGIQGQQFNQGVAAGQFGQGVQQQQFGQGAQMGQMYGQNTMDLYNQAMGMRAGQLSGANQMLSNLKGMQDLYGNIPATMGQYGQAMSGQAGAAVGAQSPYQRDRMAQLQASYAPSSGQFTGQMMGESGNRWMSAGQQMPSSFGPTTGSPSSFNPNGPQFQ
jgi:hypothetical protein